VEGCRLADGVADPFAQVGGVVQMRGGAGKVACGDRGPGAGLQDVDLVAPQRRQPERVEGGQLLGRVVGAPGQGRRQRTDRAVVADQHRPVELLVDDERLPGPPGGGLDAPRVADRAGLQHGEHRLGLRRPLGERLAVVGRDELLRLGEPAGVAQGEAAHRRVPPGVPGQGRVDVLALGLAPVNQLAGIVEAAEPGEAVGADQAGECQRLASCPRGERPRRIGGGPGALGVEQHEQA
jgi:hypothetical protein